MLAARRLSLLQFKVLLSLVGSKYSMVRYLGLR